VELQQEKTKRERGLALDFSTGEGAVPAVVARRLRIGYDT